MLRRVNLSVALFLIMSSLLYAQDNAYQFSQLDITNGLSCNQINCIYKDSQGFMWFGTSSGLNRYDGYEFKIYKHRTGDSSSVNNNYIERMFPGPGNKLWLYTHLGFSIYDPYDEKFSNNVKGELQKYHIHAIKLTSIKEDNYGRSWFIVSGQGVYCYDPKTTNTTWYNTSAKSKIVLYSNSIADIVGGDGDRLWLVYTNGVIDYVDVLNNKVLSRSFALYNDNGHRQMLYNAVAGYDKQLWIYVPSTDRGVYCYHTEAGTLLHFTKNSPEMPLSSNVIKGIVQGDEKTMWIATDQGGINIIDLATHKINYVMNRMDDPKSLRGNSVVMYKDNTGIIWAGTFKEGISYYHKKISQFPLVRHYMLDAASLPVDDVDCFVEDAAGNLWIGTNGGGLMFYDKKTKKYNLFKHNPADPNSLANDVVVTLCIDHENKLWIGTYFGGLDRLDGGKFTHYRHKDNVPESISDDRVYDIIEDASGRLWVGTFAGALNVYNRQGNNFSHPNFPALSDYTAMMYQDRQKNIWIARDRGIDVIESNGSFREYTNRPGNNNSLVSNDVNSIIQDRSGLYWLATKEGLSILNVKTGKFLNIEEAQGLPANNVKDLLEDNSGRVWLSTTNGIASIKLFPAGDTYRYEIRKYNEMDGLQGREFNANAAFKTRNGAMIFGGPNGFNWFNPASITASTAAVKVILTDFQLFNKSVAVGDTINGRVILTSSITNNPDIVLTHNENAFSISFAACDYFNPGKVTYQYKLDNFDNQWLTSASNSRSATYTNLDAGDYVFKVKAFNINQPGKQSIVVLHITIRPPFWKTTWAYILYIAAIIGILFFIRHRGILKLKKEFELNQQKQAAERNIAKEREEAQRLHELDLMKIKFFTNVSHEFRTPLSLIISPIDTLIKNNDQPENSGQLQMIKRNAKRLLNLVNQLLDFRKMESKELKLNLRKGDIIAFISEVSSSFTDLAGQNHINYSFESQGEDVVAKFDHDKLERILFNLLSNAFKFTSAGGNISVLVGLAEGEEPDKRVLEIKVTDTGIGIPKEKQTKIFEPFFQVGTPENILNQGSGIGLSITQEFVKMHGGDLFVESEPGNGSCFVVRLPLDVEDEKLPATRMVAKQPDAMPKILAALSSQNGKRPMVLLIEDNDDMRFYLKDNLKHMYNIIEAVNGKEGWQKALAQHPNLIVSDVSMPEMNGVELCKKIREDYRTNHIPVILLTALTEEKDQLAGLVNGANDYITKPFNFEILASKINGLLSLQEMMKKTYQKQKEIQVEDMVIVSEDEKFLQNVFACIDKNLNNYNFSVEKLSSHMALSRVSLYKRLLTLTGKSPVDCIRTVRLKKAVQLLEKSQLSIASIAYEVGFNNPTYFSKVFKDEYGMVPSDYLANIRKKEKELLELS
jgi:signal transduction histidine kinase/ligand-binding sensor domain-containing protein/DNA-binding response OmpR family regulator